MRIWINHEKAEIKYLVIWRRWACRSRQRHISLYASPSLTPTSRLYHLSSSSSSLCMQIFHLSSHSSRRRTRRKRRWWWWQHEWVSSQEKWVVVRIKTQLQRHNDRRWGLVLRNAAMLRTKEETVGSLSMTCSTARCVVRIPDHVHCEDSGPLSIKESNPHGCIEENFIFIHRRREIWCSGQQPILTHRPTNISCLKERPVSCSKRGRQFFIIFY